MKTFSQRTVCLATLCWRAAAAVTILSLQGTVAAEKIVTGTSTAQFNLQTTIGSGYTVTVIPGNLFDVRFNATNTVSASAVVDGGNGPFALTNNGSIRSTLNAGVFLSSVGGGTVVNQSTITGGSQGIFISGGLGSVTNAAGGQITGNTAGVQFNQGGQVLNLATATIVGSNNAGVLMNGGLAAANRVGNAGSITGATQGVLMANGGTVTNGSVDGGVTLVTGAVITGTGNGVQLGGAGGTVTNFAQNRIESLGSAGVFISAGAGTVNNAGSIAGATQGVLMTPSGTVSNVGSISGGTRGVQLSGGGTVNNGSLDGGTTIVAGALIAGTTSDGVQLGATGTVNNFAGSSITKHSDINKYASSAEN